MVAPGEVIAYAGNTGELSTGYHLHFELWIDGYPVDPTILLIFLKDYDQVISSKTVAKIIHKNQKWINNPLDYQKKIFYNLIKKATDTDFGKDHNFHKIKDYADFQTEVPVGIMKAYAPTLKRCYRVKLLCYGLVSLYTCKTSGTTSGVKYIPLAKLQCQLI